jgi:hypothetical protein
MVMKIKGMPVRKHPTLLIAIKRRLVGDTYIQVEKGPAIEQITRSGYDLHQIGVMQQGKVLAYAFIEMDPEDKLPEMKPVPFEVTRYAISDLPPHDQPVLNS